MKCNYLLNLTCFIWNKETWPISSSRNTDLTICCWKRTLPYYQSREYIGLVGDAHTLASWQRATISRTFTPNTTEHSQPPTPTYSHVLTFLLALCFGVYCWRRVGRVYLSFHSSLFCERILSWHCSLCIVYSHKLYSKQGPLK